MPNSEPAIETPVTLEDIDSARRWRNFSALSCAASLGGLAVESLSKHQVSESLVFSAVAIVEVASAISFGHKRAALLERFNRQEAVHNS